MDSLIRRIPTNLMVALLYIALLVFALIAMANPM